MPRKPFNRYAKKNRELASKEAFVKLFKVERYDRNEITNNEILRLQELIDTKGAPGAAEIVGIDDRSLLLVTSGFAHKVMPKTAEKLRDFLRKKK